MTIGMNGGGVHVTPKNIKLYNSLSCLLRDHTDRINDAYHYALEAVKWEPNWENAHNSKGSALMKLNRVLEAKAEFEVAVRLNPEYAMAYSNLGEALEKLMDLKGAEENYRKSLALDPSHGLTKFRLAGLVVLKMKNVPMAKLMEAEQLYVTHTHTHARMHTHTHAHARTHAHTRTHARTHARTRTHTHTHTCRKHFTQ